MSIAVTFVIVNWNGRRLLEDCLNSIRRQTFREFETIVVDNGSTDGSRELLREKFGDVRVLELESNHGFAEPNNLAFREAGGDFVATVNNDLTLEPGWLTPLIGALQSDESCFAAQGKILRADQPGVVDTCGLGMRPCGAARNLAHNRLGDTIRARREIFTVSAGAAVYRKSMLRQLGLFDGRYFAYYEDLDLGWRARQQGWRTMLIPEAIAYHKVHGTSGNVPGDFLWFLSERNRLRTMVKNLPLGVLMRHPMKILLDELRYIDMIRKKAGWRTLLRARLTVLGELLTLRAKRSAGAGRVTARQWRDWLQMSAE